MSSQGEIANKQKETVTVKAADGKEFSCYVSRPAAAKAPAVVVIQEIFGVNPWLRSVCDELAAKGFVAIAPDMFFRMEANVVLNPQVESDWPKAFKFYEQFNEDQGAKDVQSTLDFAKQAGGTNGKVGTLGFCLGGKLAFLSSTRTDSACNVSFYGVGIQNNLSEPVKSPTLLHIAADDKYVPPDAQAAIALALGKNERVEIETYAGVDHAFGRVGGEHYNKAAADLAFERSFAFLKKHLG